jgi:hypothetical protein
MSIGYIWCTALGVLLPAQKQDDCSESMHLFPQFAQRAKATHKVAFFFSLPLVCQGLLQEEEEWKE